MHVGGLLGPADGNNVSQGDEGRRIGQRKKLTMMQWGRGEEGGGRRKGPGTRMALRQGGQAFLYVPPSVGHWI